MLLVLRVLFYGFDLMGVGPRVTKLRERNLRALGGRQHVFAGLMGLVLRV